MSRVLCLAEGWRLWCLRICGAVFLPTPAANDLPPICAEGGTGQFFQYHPPHGQANGSFPSGHASGAFAAASVFAGMYREQHPWVPWLAYGMASLVAVSRVALGHHFPTDVRGRRVHRGQLWKDGADPQPPG